MESNLLLKALVGLALLVVLAKFFLTKRPKKYTNLPPSPPSLPIIGHLHLVVKQPLHRCFQTLTKNYGPIVHLRFGSLPVVIVSSPSLVEECFTKNDIVLANRPPFLMARYLNYNRTTMGSTDYSDHWRNLRRLGSIGIYSNHRLNTLLSIRKDEVRILLKRLQKASASAPLGFAKVGVRPFFMDLTLNSLMRMVSGKRYFGEDVDEDDEEAKDFRWIVKEFFACTSATYLGDFFPVLTWIDYDGFVGRLAKFQKHMDRVLQGMVDKNRGDEEKKDTMINQLLALQETHPEYYSDEIIKGLILMNFAGGTETSSGTMEWAISNLLNHPRVLKKARAEIDTQVGEDHLVDESDFPNLPYLTNVVNETLRLCPVGPLLSPHVSSDYCTIAGYDIPPGTLLFVNAWAIQRDPSLWTDPTTFNPDRFDNDKIGGYQLIPFGTGRRVCPAEALARRLLTLALGALIQCFEWERVDGKEVDMSEEMVMSMCKAEPLVALCKARPFVGKFTS